MGRALEGEHYCEKHQGNHSHYATENCTVCKLEADQRRLEWLVNTLESAKGGAHVYVNDELGFYDEPEPGKEVVIQWYPDTPVGFNLAEGSTIREAIDAAMEAEQ